MGPYRHEDKKYGARLYTAWVKLKSAGVTVATLKLGNHYSIRKRASNQLLLLK
jgi:hypothetical protein